MRRALVTGANRGIGAAIAKGLAAAGLDVILGARDLAAGAAVAKEIGGRAVRLDLAEAGGIAAALAEAGEIDVLVNNAGVLSDAPLFGPESDFDAAMAVMVQAPFALMRATLPGMEARGYGRIVNVSSNWGSFSAGLQGPGAYGIAKAALNALTVRAAREVSPAVKVNAMHPGWVRTRMGGADAEVSPEEGADTAIWLATLADDGPSGGFFSLRKEIDW